MQYDIIQIKMDKKLLTGIGILGMLCIIVLMSGCTEQVETNLTPSETVVAFYMAGNDGVYSKAEKYVSSDALEVMKGDLGALIGGLKGYLDKQTRGGTIEKIEITDETIRGEGSTVYFVINYKNGGTKDAYEHLIKENGVWKITIGGEDAEPPSLMVINMHSEKLDHGSYCEAEIGGEVFNLGGITAISVSVQCNVSSGSKGIGFASVGYVEGRKSVKFEVKVPLESCSASISESCKVTCENCE